ncbi:MAG: hypothetical protein GY820_03510 [Gammaproteobacteria bacterium]|nr:hypothetical protein [Gammaproteobacteria bacterium]
MRRHSYVISGANLASLCRRRPRPVRAATGLSERNLTRTYAACLRTSEQNFCSIDQSQLEQDIADC